jgi:DNA-binding IclR family transcriptional regulator
MAKRTDSDYAVEKTIETLKILEVLDYEPISVETVITRVGKIPTLDRKISPDAARRILITLKLLGYAQQNEKTKLWNRSHKRI